MLFKAAIPRFSIRIRICVSASVSRINADTLFHVSVSVKRICLFLHLNTTVPTYRYRSHVNSTPFIQKCGDCKLFLACRSRQASIVLERYFRTEVSLLYFYACERDGPI